MPYGLWPMATAASAGSRRLRAGIPVRFAHSNVVGTYGSPTNAPLPGRLHLGFLENAKELPPPGAVLTTVFRRGGWLVSLKRLSFPFDPSLIYGGEADMIKARSQIFQ